MDHDKLNKHERGGGDTVVILRRFHKGISFLPIGYLLVVYHRSRGFAIFRDKIEPVIAIGRGVWYSIDYTRVCICMYRRKSDAG